MPITWKLGRIEYLNPQITDGKKFMRYKGFYDQGQNRDKLVAMGETPIKLGADLYNIQRTILDNLEAPDFLDTNRWVDGKLALITGIPLSEDEIREVMKGFMIARQTHKD
jgi:hypothetical protein